MASSDAPERLDTGSLAVVHGPSQSPHPLGCSDSQRGQNSAPNQGGGFEFLVCLTLRVY